MVVLSKSKTAYGLQSGSLPFLPHSAIIFSRAACASSVHPSLGSTSVSPQDRNRKRPARNAPASPLSIELFLYISDKA